MKKIFFFLILVSVFFSCKKGQSNSLSKSFLMTAYVVGSSGVSLYPEPSFSAKIASIVPVNSEVKILEKGIPDKIRKNFTWLKVKLNELEGYISSEEAERYNDPSLSIFTDIDSPRKLLVRATSLRLRKKPSLKGEILTNLKNGEEVTLIAEGSASEKIDDIYDNWVKVKTKDGKIGYCFSGFLISPPESFGSGNLKMEVALGYIKITNKTVFYSEPGKPEEAPKEIADPDSPEHKVMNHIFQFKEEDIIPVQYKVSIDGTTYFSLIITFYKNDGMESQKFSSSGWVSEKEIVYLENLLDHTYENYSNQYEGEELLYLYLKDRKKRIDFRNVNINWMEEGSYGIAKLNYSTAINNEPDIFIVFKFDFEKKEIKEIGGLPENGHWGTALEWVDLTEDNIQEIVYRLYGRGSTSFQVYKLSPTGLKEVLSLSEGEVYDQESNDWGFSEISIENNKILYTVKWQNRDKITTQEYTYNPSTEKFQISK